jgi:hypothetical protein
VRDLVALVGSMQSGLRGLLTRSRGTRLRRQPDPIVRIGRSLVRDGLEDRSEVLLLLFGRLVREPIT